MKTLDTEQVSRLSAAHSAHSWIIEKIDSGATMFEIRNHCFLMKRAAERQLNVLLKDEKSEQPTKLDLS